MPPSLLRTGDARRVLAGFIPSDRICNIEWPDLIQRSGGGPMASRASGRREPRSLNPTGGSG
jgi:hypothetical protein